MGLAISKDQVIKHIENMPNQKFYNIAEIVKSKTKGVKEILQGHEDSLNILISASILIYALNENKY